MAESWEKEAVTFDQIYSGGGLAGRIPLLGPFIQKGIIERHNRALAFLSATRAQTILDLGCGVGRFAVAAAQRGVTVHAYDISQPAIAVAQEAARRAGVSDRCHFYAADLLAVDFPAADAWFDLGCLHYLPDPAQVITEANPGATSFLLPAPERALAGTVPLCLPHPPAGSEIPFLYRGRDQELAGSLSPFRHSKNQVWCIMSPRWLEGLASLDKRQASGRPFAGTPGQQQILVVLGGPGAGFFRAPVWLDLSQEFHRRRRYPLPLDQPTCQPGRLAALAATVHFSTATCSDGLIGPDHSGSFAGRAG